MSASFIHSMHFSEISPVSRASPAHMNRHAGTAFEHKAHEQFKNCRGKLVKEMLPIDSLGAVHMSRVSPATANMRWLK